jgi:hypothetical protein
LEINNTIVDDDFRVLLGKLKISLELNNLFLDDAFRAFLYIIEDFFWY